MRLPFVQILALRLLFFMDQLHMFFKCCLAVAMKFFVKGKSYAELGWFTSLNELVSTGYCV